MHNNTSAIPHGKAMLQGATHTYCNSLSLTLILGKNYSIGMKLVQNLDCDDIHSITSDAPNSHSFQSLSYPMLQQYHDAFNGLGELPGEYTMPKKSILYLSSRLPISLISVVKDMMVDKCMIVQVTEPTPWVSSMVGAQKKDGRFASALTHNIWTDS